MSVINWSLRTAPKIAWFLSWQALLRAFDRHRGRAREIELARFVFENAIAGDPASVLETMDRFSQTRRFLMSMGPDKGAHLLELLNAHQPRNVLEIGTYCGYSAVLIGSRVAKWGGKVTTLEVSRRNHAVARDIIAHAGLSDRISAINATLSKALPDIREPFDFVLLDHWKDEYLPDLNRLESSGLLGTGAVVMADNVGFFKVPDYLDYVRNSGLYQSRSIASTVEYQPNLPDAIEVSIFKKLIR